MNRADKICIGLILICSVLFYVPLYMTGQNTQGKKEVVVSYKDQEILRKDLKENNVYTVKGTLGKVQIEVKDKKVRVEKETSPYHLCSIQGWVDAPNRPIVCLPNNIVVLIESSKDTKEDVDTVIQ